MIEILENKLAQQNTWNFIFFVLCEWVDLTTHIGVDK